MKIETIEKANSLIREINMEKLKRDEFSKTMEGIRERGIEVGSGFMTGPILIPFSVLETWFKEQIDACDWKISELEKEFEDLHEWDDNLPSVKGELVNFLYVNAIRLLDDKQRSMLSEMIRPK